MTGVVSRVSGAIVVGGQDGEMSIVTHVDPNEFQVITFQPFLRIGEAIEVVHI